MCHIPDFLHFLMSVIVGDEHKAWHAYPANAPGRAHFGGLAITLYQLLGVFVSNVKLFLPYRYSKFEDL